jgi:hypothetical protein
MGEVLRANGEDQRGGVRRGRAQARLYSWRGALNGFEGCNVACGEGARLRRRGKGQWPVAIKAQRASVERQFQEGKRRGGGGSVPVH